MSRLRLVYEGVCGSYERVNCVATLSITIVPAVLVVECGANGVRVLGCAALGGLLLGWFVGCVLLRASCVVGLISGVRV